MGGERFDLERAPPVDVGDPLIPDESALADERKPGKDGGAAPPVADALECVVGRFDSIDARGGAIRQPLRPATRVQQRLPDLMGWSGDKGGSLELGCGGHVSHFCGRGAVWARAGEETGGDAAVFRGAKPSPQPSPRGRGSYAARLSVASTNE